jgi:hypothetical protein
MKISATKFSPESNPKQIDPTGLSWCEMALLRKKDPFMYYSIPGTREAKGSGAVPGDDVDLSDLNLSESARSRSFTALEIDARRSNDAIKQPRRHSHSIQGSPDRGANEDFAIQHPPRRQSHGRSKSLADAILSEPIKDRHRRTTSAPVINSNVVTRKSIISFERYGDDTLDDIIDEVGELQPKREMSDFKSLDDIRRGSVLQDILFSSIAALQGEGDWDSDSE